MSNRRIAIAVLMTLVLSLAVQAPAQAEVDFTVGLAQMTGETWYQIGGNVGDPFGLYQVHFPLSELRFPMDVYLLTLGAGIPFSERYTASIDVSANLTTDAGQMEDSDWGTVYLDYGFPATATSLDIFSLSDAEMNGSMVDLKLRYLVLDANGFTFSAGIGYRYQIFDWEMSDLDQWYPSSEQYFGYDFPHDMVTGLVGSYEVTFSIPYGEVAAGMKLGENLSLEASLGYSPIATAEDVDDHKLRSIKATTEADGSAVLFAFSGRYNFTGNWFAVLDVSFVTIDTEGTEYDLVYAGANAGMTWTIDHTIDSKQTLVNAAIGFTF